MQSIGGGGGALSYRLQQGEPQMATAELTDRSGVRG